MHLWDSKRAGIHIMDFWSFFRGLTLGAGDRVSIPSGGRAFPHQWQICSLASGVESHPWMEAVILYTFCTEPLHISQQDPTPTPHCLMGVSTRPAWHSEFYAWLFLLWPRLIQNSCWINLKGGAFWENLSSVVTSLDSRKTNWEIIKRTFLLAIRGITVNIVTTTEILIPVQAFLKAFIASYSLFLGDILPFL